MRFTHFYAGAPVCAPSRAVLMTGRHVGHVSVRGNAGGKNYSDPATMRPQTLRPEETTLPEMLKKSGYATSLIGKWGIGELASGSEPTHRGFDYFYGYLNQVHAHNYWPAWLVRNESPVGLRNVVPGDGPFGQGWATVKIDYSPDKFSGEALHWVEEQKDHPFFLYLAYTIPHANDEATKALGNGQEVPNLGPYADKDWTEPNKGQAAMITRMDGDIGRLFALLKKLGLDEKTIVLFSSDNGPHHEGGNDPAFFNASGGLRGIKRDVYEGGIREPFLVRWPGKVAAAWKNLRACRLFRQGCHADLRRSHHRCAARRPGISIASASCPNCSASRKRNTTTCIGNSTRAAPSRPCSWKNTGKPSACGPMDRRKSTTSPPTPAKATTSTTRIRNSCSAARSFSRPRAPTTPTGPSVSPTRRPKRPRRRNSRRKTEGSEGSEGSSFFASFAPFCSRAFRFSRSRVAAFRVRWASPPTGLGVSPEP